MKNEQVMSDEKSTFINFIDESIASLINTAIADNNGGIVPPDVEITPEKIEATRKKVIDKLQDEFGRKNIDSSKTVEENMQIVLKNSFDPTLTNEILRAFARTLPTKIGCVILERLSAKYFDNTEQVMSFIESETTENLCILATNKKFPIGVTTRAIGELTKRNNREIQALREKYSDIDGKNAQMYLSGKKVAEIDQTLKEHMKKIDEWTKGTSEKQREMAMQKTTTDCFNFVTQLGLATHNKNLVTIGNIGMMGVVAYQSISTLISGALTFSCAIPAIGALIGVGTFLFQLFSKPKKDKSMEILMGQLQKISEQIHFLHMDMREHFRHVFRALDKILTKINTNHGILLGIQLQVCSLEKRLIHHRMVDEYVHQRNFVSGLTEILTGIVNGNDAYYENMSSDTFNRLFICLYNWITVNSFDRGSNGHCITIFTTEQIVDSLSSPVFYRIGYLAEYLHDLNASSMVVPDLWSDSVNGLIVLINNGLIHHGNLPMNDIEAKINDVIENVDKTIRFIENTHEIIEQRLTRYRQAIENLHAKIIEWKFRVSQVYSHGNFCLPDVLSGISEMIQNVVLLNGRTKATGSSRPSGVREVEISFLMNAITNPIIISAIRYASLSELLKIGKLEVLFDSSVCGLSFPKKRGYGGCTVCGTFTINYVNENDVRIFLCKQSWCRNVSLHCDSDWDHGAGAMARCLFLSHWNNASWSSPVTECTEESNELMLEKIIAKIDEILGELSNINNPDGIAVNDACIKIQQEHVVLKSLYELHGQSMQNIVSGETFKHKMLEPDDILGFISSSVELTPVIVENGQPIVEIIRQSVFGLRSLIGRIEEILNDYGENVSHENFIRTQANDENIRLLLREQQNRDEEMRRKYADEMDKIGFEMGKHNTRQAMILKLREIGNPDEAKILEDSLPECEAQGSVDGEISKEFRLSYINGMKYVASEAVELLIVNGHVNVALAILRQSNASSMLMRDAENIGMLLSENRMIL